MAERIKAFLMWKVNEGQEEEFKRRWQMDSDEAVSEFIFGGIYHEPTIFSNPPALDLGPTPSESYTHKSVLGGSQ